MDDTKKVRIKVLTLNIHKGFSFANRHFTLDKMKSSIRETKADLVCLQEVLGLNKKMNGGPQFEFLSDQIWSHYAYGKNAVYSNGHHGNAILSHYPFLSYENFDISNHRYEQRGILYGIVSCPKWHSSKLHVLTLHLDLTAWGRARQLEKLCQFINKRIPSDQPLLICGDFNDWTELASVFLEKEVGLTEAHLQFTGLHAKTFPAIFPFLRLDRIYVRGIKVENILCLDQKNWRELSDHLAIMAELSWPIPF